MRKLAFCHDCKKKRKILVRMWANKIYDPTSQETFYSDLGDGDILCSACHGTKLGLGDDERDKLLSAAFESVA